MTAALLDPRFDVVNDEEGPCLRGLRELPSGARTLLGRETPFVGREWEVASIQDLWARCIEEPQALAVLVTAAGRGGEDAVRARGGADARGGAARRGRRALGVVRPGGPAARRGRRWSSLAQVIRSACGLAAGGRGLGGCDGKRLRRRVWSGTCRSARRACGWRSSSGRVVGLPFPAEDSFELRAARRDPRIMSEQARRAFQELLSAECQARGRC